MTLPVVDELLATLADVLQESGGTVAAVESVTGGGVIRALIRRPDLSRRVRGGLVLYNTDVKITVGGVPEEDVARHGLVSEEVATAMAWSGRALMGADYCVATTGYAGPPNGREDKPVGTVCVAVAARGVPVRARTRVFAGDRARVCDQAEAFALEMLADLVRDRAPGA